jgi:hypothetical protein
MRTILFFFALTLFGTAACTAQSVVFKFQDPTSGIVRATETGTSFKVTATADMGGEPKTMQILNRNRNNRKETFLDVVDGKPRRLKVIWDMYQQEESSPMGGGRGDRKRPAPELNVSYVVELTGTDVTVTREDKSEVPADVLRFFKDEYSRDANEIGKFLNGKTVTLNSPVVVEKELAASLIGRLRGQMEIKELSMTLIGKRTVVGIDCAVFSVHVQGTVNMGPMVQELSADGELLIDPARTWPVSFGISGPVVIAPSNTGMNVSGDGTFSVSKKWTYQ